MRPATARNALIALLLLTEASHEWWMRADSIPQGWDQAALLTAAERFRNMGVAESAVRFPVDPGYYPPLVPWLASVSGRGFGNTDDGFTRIMPVFRVLLIGATYRLGLRWLSPAGALASAVLLATAPLVVRDGRYLTLDLPLAAMTVLGLLRLADGALRTRSGAIGFGAVAGLGMLVKWTLPIYLLAPVFAATRWTRASRRQVATAALVAAAICAVWYAGSFSHLRRALHHAAYTGADIAGDRVFSRFSISFYPLSLPESAGWPLTALAAAGLLLALRDPRWRGRLLFLLVPLLLLILIRNKKERYFAPVYPLLAILAGLAVDRIRRTDRRRLAVASVLAVGLLQFVSLTFPVPWPPGRSFRPTAQDWPMDEIVRRVAAGGGGSLAVVPDLQTMNLHMAEFQALRHGSVVRPAGIADVPGTLDWALVKNGAQGPWHSTPERRERLTRELLSTAGTGALFRTVASWPLPDGSTARLLRRRSAGLERSALETALRAGWKDRFAQPWTLSAIPGTGSATVEVQVRGAPLTLHLDADGTPVPLRFRRLAIRYAGATPYLQPDGGLALRCDRVRIAEAVLDAGDLTAFLAAARPHWKHGDLRLVAKAVRSVLRRLEHPRLAVEEDAWTLTGTLHGRPLRLTGSLAARAGRLTYRIASCRWAGVPLPAFAIRRGSSGRLLAVEYPLADRIECPGVVLQPGQVVAGTLRPD